MSTLVDQILSAPSWLVLGFVGLFVFAEDALFIGFVIPGETAAILGGVASSRGHVSVLALMLTVVGAAVVGDSVGYEVGRSVGARALRSGVFDRHRNRLHAAQDLLARRGGMAVLLGRWLAFFRAIMPALAGSALMPYRRFLLFNALGGIGWGVAVVLAGYLAGASYATLERFVGQGTAVAGAIVLVGGLTAWRLRRHWRESIAAGAPSDYP